MLVLDKFNPCTQSGITSRAYSGNAMSPCCILAVPQSKVVRKAIIDSSTSNVSFDSLLSAFLSLKLSLPRCCALLHHTVTVFLDTLNILATSVFSKPLLTASTMERRCSGCRRMIYPTLIPSLRKKKDKRTHKKEYLNV